VAIHRVGPEPNTQVHRRNLGRVIVTIDDLAALIAVLAENRNEIDQIRVRFEGGYFTEPEDMRRLSDDELKSLRLATDQVEIILQRSEAVAVGKGEATENIYRSWARARQLRERGLSKGWIAAFLAFVLTFSSYMAAVFFGTRTTSNLSGSLYFEPLLLIITLGLFITVALSRWVYELTEARRTRWATIVPLTLQEYRQMQTTDDYPRKAWIISIVALIVGIAVGLIPVFLDK
jgi:hypothetical protein